MGASDDFASLIRGHTSFLRLNAYSDAHRLKQSQSKGPDSPLQLGIHRHTDAGLLTLLVEDGHHALRVLHDRQWHMIEPAPNAFIVNTGDMLQVLSNDCFVAPEHRVLRSVGSQYRLSAAYFFNPPYAQVIEALPCKPVDANADSNGDSKGNKPHYRSFTW